MPIAIAELTTATLNGEGAFDVLMRANKAHLEDEYKAGRIRGPEYATVYMGLLEPVMETALAFLLARDKIALEAQLLQKQIELADKQILKVAAEIELVGAQKDLAAQQALNAVKEGAVLDATACKLQAEYDVLILTKDKVGQETALLTWKVATEKGQTLAGGVEDNSVIGRQKILYKAQADGFVRDAEQKAAKIMVDSWNVRRTTDEGTVADDTNKLNDAAVGRAVTALLTGVGA
jgi:hypothetical protein